MDNNVNNFYNQLFPVIKQAYQQETILSEQAAYKQLQESAKLFLKDVVTLLPEISNFTSLKERLQQIGQLMHSSEYYTQQLYLLSQPFEEKYNAFINRTIILTLLSPQTGKLYFLTQTQVRQLYQQLKISGRGTGKLFYGFRGQSVDEVLNLLSFTKNDTFNNPLLQQFIKQIDKLTAARGAVFIEANRRRTNSRLRKGKNALPKNSLYWHPDLDQDKEPLPQPDGLSIARSQLGQAYVDYIVNQADSMFTISYRGAYSRLGEDEIFNLSHYLLNYDNRPGAALGDILQVSSDGRIQLAVKTGGFFNMESVKPIIAIAQAIIDRKQVLTGQELKRKLEEVLPKQLEKNKTLSNWSEEIYKIIVDDVYHTITKNI